MNKLKKQEAEKQRSRDCSIFFASLLLCLLLLLSEDAYACPACKEAVAKMGEIWTALGFNWSVLFMVSVPFLIVGSFAGVIVWNYKKRKHA